LTTTFATLFLHRVELSQIVGADREVNCRIRQDELGQQMERQSPT